MSTFTESEPASPIAYTYKAERLLSHRSSHYLIEVYRSPYFGNILVLDGIVQLTERDQHIYHEMLVHVPLNLHPAPRKALVIGGGDGGTLTQLVRHEALDEITLIEIDPDVVSISKRYFPDLAPGFEDPRVRIHFDDGKRYLETVDNSYDAILVDSTDPIGPAESLYTLEFFELARAALARQGVFVIQSESLYFHAKVVAQVQSYLRRCFRYVDVYGACIATYPGNLWTFSIASDAFNPRGKIGRVRVEGRYFSSGVHAWAFLPAGLLQQFGVVC